MVAIGDIRKITSSSQTTTFQIMSIETNGDCLVQRNGVLTTILSNDMTTSRLCCNAPIRFHRNQRVRNVKPKTIVVLPTKRETRKEKSAYIYMMGLSNNYVKIGRSRFPEKRIKALRTGATERIDILNTWKVPAHLASYIETQVKHAFAEKFKSSAGGTEVFKMPNTNRQNASRMITPELQNM